VTFGITKNQQLHTCHTPCYTFSYFSEEEEEWEKENEEEIGTGIYTQINLKT
jgi:hypothetical protein